MVYGINYSSKQGGKEVTEGPWEQCSYHQSESPLWNEWPQLVELCWIGLDTESEELTKDDMELPRSNVFLGKKLWDETKTLNILQAIAGESLNLSGLPRDFENQLTTERPGPLCSFKNANSGFIFPTVMQKTELWLPTVPSPPFYPALHPSWNSISCPSPPLLHNSSWGSYTSGSKFINFAWLPNLLYTKAFWDWNQSASWLRGTRPSSASEGMGLPKSSLGFCSMKCRKIP